MLDNVDAALESAIASHEAGDLIVAGEKYLEILKSCKIKLTLYFLIKKN